MFQEKNVGKLEAKSLTTTPLLHLRTCVLAVSVHVSGKCLLDLLYRNVSGIVNVKVFLCLW